MANVYISTGPGFKTWGNLFTTQMNLLPRGPVLQCPTITNTSGGRINPATTGDLWYLYGLYRPWIDTTAGKAAVKANLGDFAQSPATDTNYHIVSRMRSPSRTFGLADAVELTAAAPSGTVKGNSTSFACEPLTSGKNYLAIAHANQTNVSFADGHAISMNRNELKDSPMLIKRIYDHLNARAENL